MVSAQVATVVVLVLIVTVVFVAMCFLVKCCFRSGSYKGKMDDAEYQKPTLLRYWKHEHSLLGILWQKPPYRTNAVELDRKRKVMLLALMFLLNFMVIGFASLFTPSYPSCPQCKDAMENARLDRAGPTFTPFLVGYNENLRTWLYEDSGSTSFIKFKDKAQSANIGVAEERPCWEYCKSVNGTTPKRDFISRFIISRSLVDKRLECAQVQSATLRASLICFDFKWKDQEDCGGSVLVSLSSTEFILRGILVVFVVLPLVVVYKRLLRCTEDDTQPCIGHFFAYPFIIILFVVCFILAWVLAISLQGEIIGDFTISFIFSFLLSLAFEFPKLGLFYIAYKGKKLERLYMETVEGAVVDGVLVLDSMTSSSSVDIVDASAYASRAAPSFQPPYADAPQQFHPPPGTPYGAPPVYSPYGGQAGYGSAPPGAPYGYQCA